MWKSIKFFMLTLFIFPILLFAGTANETIRLCAHHDYPPWNWKQEDHIVGACVSSAKRIFTKLGYEVDTRYIGPWKRCLRLMEEGEVDVIPCSFKNTERESYSWFSNVPMGYIDQVLFVHQDSDWPYQAWPDLKGKKASMVLGVSIGKQVDDFLAENVTIYRVNSFYAAFGMLEKKRIDFVPMGRYAGRIFYKMGGFRGIKELPVPLIRGEMFISISKKGRLKKDIISKIDSLINPLHYLHLLNDLTWYTQEYITEQHVLGPWREGME